VRSGAAAVSASSCASTSEEPSFFSSMTALELLLPLFLVPLRFVLVPSTSEAPKVEEFIIRYGRTGVEGGLPDRSSTIKGSESVDSAQMRYRRAPI
jgi:hypothetical protein